ncbi:enolase C-terminal domain-like protein [Loigolactobacillus zhaoyuanensis]|uniref:enolase C-terminal domain-like protein n=1 Tax=Loigolactobacillus zhaoyuanensis TaxID=2486017 RepID=UPI000F737627|nr:enolase C-terminal domain-like protein [Loigolactobacillus zhaoyuanensis]
MTSVIPKITAMKVYPVAGYDSMLLTLSGAHYPYFTRNIVVLTDDSGQMGIGEIHGGDSITKSLESYKPLIIGQKITEYRRILNDIRQKGWREKNDSGQGLQQLNLANLKYVVHAEAAIECALLDLYGKFVNLPMCDIIGDGRQRDKVEMLGYLFYIGDYHKTDLPYIHDDDNDAWGKVRRQETLTVAGIVKQAEAAQARYGFKNFKLKGGVLSGDEEMQAVVALHKRFPDARINLDPNGAWSLQEAIDLTHKYGDALTYLEDPCGPESGFSGREIMSFYKNATNMPVATNMIATDWKQFYPSLMMKSVDIVLADPHFWGINGSLRMASVLNDWGLTWGSHSNNHFDITLALYAQVSAAAPGNITAIDTHFIWQDDQQLCDDALQISDGGIKIPKRPGLGININLEKLEAANKLYTTLKHHDRDDSLAMQYLIPGWQFDPKQPTLVR